MVPLALRHRTALPSLGLAMRQLSCGRAVQINPSSSRVLGCYLGMHLASMPLSTSGESSCSCACTRVQINPSSSVLRCYLGMALAKAGEPDQALHVLGVAIERDPRNPLASFERAHVLMQYGRLEDALMELEALKVVAILLSCT